MDPVSVLGLVETCYTLGVKILDICSTWKHADSEVEKRVIIIESCWDRTKRQVDFVMRITSIMDEDHCRMMDELLNQLVLSLSLAMSSLETVIEKRSSARSGVFRLGFRAKKAAWVWKKEALDGIISELEEWQRRFDPSWFLLMKIANPVLDRELALAKTTEAKAHGLATAAKTPLALATGLRNVLSPSTEQTRSIVLKELQMEWLDIPFSVARMGRGRQGNDKKWYIVDTIELGQAARVRDVMQDVRVLATKLSQADPLAFGLLNCKGIVPVLQQPVSPTPPTQLTLDPSTSSSSLSRAHSPSPGQVRYSHIQLIFRVPRRTEKLQSLRQLLLHADEHISLSRKVYMARELAKAVNYVHTFAFVHKNVRPESVLCFEDPQAASSHAFLVGFGAFRGADAGTMMGEI
ncbi:hypothetical protein N7517_004066 [Penicillium concentricum]|uniref:Protein kinase domain-containing protein n=1 Tax=Penicillium concentricum TaxID=293559 RepID=A0A9W9S668_9EURO|nr:uncharacterized protein N7517_004066 [Penicillium concentricum]KAJ5372060.1 hypothetical protein N7517_004066 [Penicillium concentricum]